MVGRGLEVIIGMNRDPHFGPLLMFGLGGIFVEVLKDVTFYLAPITLDEAVQMLNQLGRLGNQKDIREGIDLVLKRYEHALPGQMSLSDAPAKAANKK